MEQSSLTEQETKKRPGPAPKPKVDIEEFKKLQAEVHNLQELITRMAHQSGTSHQLLMKAGLEPYQPTKNDMSKFKVV